MQIQDVILKNGHRIPLLGLGTWKADQNDCYRACLFSLQNGYKMIDTANMYQNESEVGRAIKDSGIARDQIYVITKLDINMHGFYESKLSLQKSLNQLGLEYVDMYLIHNPKYGKVIETWQGMIECQKLGLTISIGVSNFGKNQLEQLTNHSNQRPQLNQIEIHLWNQPQDLIDYCKQNFIQPMGFCPLAKAQLFDKNDILIELTQKYKKTEAQIAIRWSIQNGIITIPKSVNEQRILENAAVFDFEINEDDMKKLRQLNSNTIISSATPAQQISWDDIK